MKVIFVKRVEKRRDHDREGALVVKAIGKASPKARFGPFWLSVDATKSSEHRELATVFERDAANVDGIRIGVLAHQIEARHLAAIVGAALLDTRHALPKVSLGFLVQRLLEAREAERHA